MVDIVDVGKFLKGVKVGDVSFIIENNKELLDEIVNKIKKRENFKIKSFTNKEIQFLRNEVLGFYEIVDAYTKKLARLPLAT